MFEYVKSGGYYILEDMSIPGNHVCCIRNDRTFEIINEFKTSKIFQTDIINENEKKYLTENIESIEIFPDIKNAYAVAIIKKK